jgi:hypothetical protein
MPDPFNINWFPDSWLSFVLFALPAGGKSVPEFTPIVTDIKAEVASFQDIVQREGQSRAVRRQNLLQAKALASKDEASKSPRTSSITIVHEIREDASSVDDKRIFLDLREALAFWESGLATDEDAEATRALMMNARRQLSSMYAARVTGSKRRLEVRIA